MVVLKGGGGSGWHKIAMWQMCIMDGALVDACTMCSPDKERQIAGSACVWRRSRTADAASTGGCQCTTHLSVWLDDLDGIRSKINFSVVANKNLTILQMPLLYLGVCYKHAEVKIALLWE